MYEKSNVNIPLKARKYNPVEKSGHISPCFEKRSATIKIFIDGEDGTEIGECKIGAASGTYTSVVKNVTGRHSVFFVIEHNYEGWFVEWYKDRMLFDLESFVFMK